MDSQNDKKELNSFIDDFLIIDKEKIEEEGNLDIMNSKILFEKAKNSICQIFKDKGYGIGFFCKIKYPNKYNEIFV